MDAVRCAVFGLGRLGHQHAINLATRVPGAKLVAVLDSVPELAEKTARELGVQRWSTEPDELLAATDIDAIFVVTPTSTHATLAKKVAESGKALFLEKPVSLDLEEAAATVHAVEASGILCQLGFMRRFDPAYKAAKAQIAAGAIGEPLYFKGISRDPQAPPETYVAASGGIFADQSIHDYDIARFMMEREVTSVSAVGSVLYSKEVARYNDVDQALSYLRFEGGAAGDIEAYRNAFYGYDIRAEILGTEGTLVVSGLRQQNVTLLSNRGSNYEILPGFIERFKEAYVDELIAFIQCVQQGERPSVGVRDGYQALAIATAAKRSYQEKREVAVPGLNEVNVS
ncbi:inositol 2-dehydrogenase [Alicyclobacillus fodiniaquatilis]|jgi:scyllo-inositol 2-dehydrogenase (NAD+)|uniref:Inositol 2-dehydrogenase n=1 Tax=Alicyclobacillus fodiniaquatilis TaxID=1661150 RepID=A0ABW4JIT2_9BACL